MRNTTPAILKRIDRIQRLKRTLWILGIGYLGIVVVFAWLESYLVYPAPPLAQGDWEPDGVHFEEVECETSAKNRIHGWYCEHASPQVHILFCHGNGSDVASCAESVAYLRDRYSASVFVFDYRGYGKSPGKPFEAGLLLDGEAAHRWLASKAGIPRSDVVLWGQSLGGAIAVHLSAKMGARGVILDRTFDSMIDVAAHHYPWLPVRWVMANRYPSAERFRGYDGPLLQVHGQPDEVVPFKSGQRLFDASPSNRKQLLSEVPLMHNDPWPETYFLAVESFLNSLPPIGEPR